MYGKHERIWQNGAMSEGKHNWCLYRGAIPTLEEKQVRLYARSEVQNARGFGTSNESLTS